LNRRSKFPNLYDAEGHCIFECLGEFATEEEEFQGVYYQQELVNPEHAKRKPCCMACGKFRVCPVACDVVKHLMTLGFGK